MQLQQLLSRAESFAPLSLAEGWDKVGLAVGDMDAEVKRVLLCIDLTPSVLGEAIAREAQLIVAYHPPIFEPLKTVTAGTVKQRMILKAIEYKIAIYSPHTALDACAGGFNDRLAHRLAEGKAGEKTAAGATIRPIRASKEQQAAEYKICVFAPRSHVSGVRDAMADAGAGIIGNYTKCSFNVQGLGTFLGNEKSNPAMGISGMFESVEETRIEMVCPQWALVRVVKAIRKSHPYEEPAFDIYRLEGTPSTEAATKGQGRTIRLDSPISPETLVRRVKKALGVKYVEAGTPAGLTAIDAIGVCVGSGGSLLAEAPGVQAFVTGEMRHHDVLEAVGRGVMIVLAGHTQTERPFLGGYQEQLSGLLKEEKVEVLVSTTDAAPTTIG